MSIVPSKLSDAFSEEEKRRANRIAHLWRSTFVVDPPYRDIFDENQTPTQDGSSVDGNPAIHPSSGTGSERVRYPLARLAPVPSARWFVAMAVLHAVTSDPVPTFWRSPRPLVTATALLKPHVVAIL